ncbi:MAG TPA: hypothetical protein VGG39_13875 [Polyangiaceae bacterium]|jgi:hypothetical protein
MTLRPVRLVPVVLALSVGAALSGVLAATGCGNSKASAGSPGGSTDAAPVEAEGYDAGTITEKALTLTLTLGTAAPPADGGAGGGDGGGDAGAIPATTLTIAAADGTTPVVTDLWLYTLDGQGTQTPLTGFTSTQPRKSPRLMLPAAISGTPSGLAPADDGNANGTMTCSCTRGQLEEGSFVPTFTGTVTVTFAAAPTTAILVVAGIEDERYAGAAVVNPDGTAGTIPAGEGVAGTHSRVSFQRDVLPILHVACVTCHTGKGPTSDAGAGVGPGFNANYYLVTGTADDLVNGNFALNEQTGDCQVANPDGGAPLEACIQAITQAQFLVEPGAPAASDLLQRARPDENAGTSTEGVLWYGSKGKRYNATYGDRRMPSTTLDTSADGGNWNDQPCYFDTNAQQFQVLYDWVAQGALAN